jgi:hypothetical protein
MNTKIPLDLQIEKASKLINQQKALLARLTAQKSAAAKKEKKKLDDRRKILVGAVILKKAETDLAFAAELHLWLDAGLTREIDRAAFPQLTKLKT